ncbi:hypothetical protein WR25_03822 [Diploscapter pachys]|uniref:Uncharacterized protein n=1 Tax=Diploscapter pachys TaxID=2018661 RepID=A0A2A2KWQ1_9BILA|nr:hypothetical protein WR25_03822 [Diploscapter pachys]
MWPRGFPLEYFSQHNHTDANFRLCEVQKRAAVQQGLVDMDPDVDAIFRTTDIWRSYFSQKLLHLIDEYVAFYPVNAVQIRNAHNYLKDFEDEQEVYLKSGALLKLLDEWKCSQKTTANCAIELAEQFG